MPDDAPSVKQAATRGYGAEVLLYNRSEMTREDLAQKLMSERQLTFIPPFDHPHVVAGQGTTAKELIDEVGQLDLLLVCCGGGGLLFWLCDRNLSIIPRMSSYWRGTRTSR